jgi:hypothetical protein
MRSKGVGQIITDEGYFSIVRGIQVFTSNHNVVQADGVQEKLLSRL